MNFMNFVNVVRGLAGEDVIISSLLRSLGKLIEKKRFSISPTWWGRPRLKFMKFTKFTPGRLRVTKTSKAGLKAAGMPRRQMGGPSRHTAGLPEITPRPLDIATVDTGSPTQI